jgi:hypothetical protein
VTLHCALTLSPRPFLPPPLLRSPATSTHTQTACPAPAVHRAVRAWAAGGVVTNRNKMIPSLLGEPAAWGAAVWQLVALWLVGALCGWLVSPTAAVRATSQSQRLPHHPSPRTPSAPQIPRPSKTQGSSSASAVWQAAVSSSLAWRRATIAWHGFVIARCALRFAAEHALVCAWSSWRGVGGGGG